MIVQCEAESSKYKACKDSMESADGMLQWLGQNETRGKLSSKGFVFYIDPFTTST